VLIGRERESARLRQLLENAAAGRSATLVVRGEPGVGKTTLLDLAIQEASGFEVVHIVGVESEAELPYAGLHAVLRRFVGLLDVVPEVQARALRVALGVELGDPDPFLAGAGTLTLLAQTAEQRPLLVVIDDAHWLDHASIDALVFVARRLAAESIALLVAVRTGEVAFERSGVEELVVEPLNNEDATELLRDRWGGDVDPSVARRLAAATRGNPLALVEVTQQLTDAERLGVAPLTEPLPVSGAVERGVRRRLAALPPSVREAALLAATDEAAAPIINLHDVQAAEDAGLLQLHRGKVVFSHPLYRLAVYQAASAEERRAAHRRIAGALTGEDERDLRAWHLAAAAHGPDEEAAGALEAAADRAEARGGTAARARALERAAELSVSEADRGRRLYAAARAATWAGATGHARGLLERALPEAQDPLIRADLLHALANIVDGQGAPVPTALLEQEVAAVADADANRAAQLLMPLLARFSDNDVSVPDLLRVAGQFEALVPRLNEWWRPRAIGSAAFAHMLAGDASRANQLVDEMVDDPLAATTQGPLLIRLERYDDAQQALQTSLELGRASAQPLRTAWTQMCFGLLHQALGRLPQAVAAFAEAASIGREIEAYWIATGATLGLADVAADQGRTADCRELAREATSLGVQLSDEHTLLAAAVPQARAALSEGRHGETVELLEPVAARLSSSGRRDPTFIAYETELVEAQIRLGDTAAARATLEGFADRATATGCRWALAAVDRYEGLLAGERDYDGRFAAALAHHQTAPQPLGEARTRLCYGERLRRSRRRREAREQLRPALELFERLGAATWADRARVELEATGVKIPRRDPTEPERLTPQELQIALQVADGRTNRDVAAALYLSPKTVEYHLTHVYRKLDIHSRGELIRRFAANAERAASSTEVR
jgi:DNA-binding CsgD family transcriptional regulator